MYSDHQKTLPVLFPSVLCIELVSGEMSNQIRTVQTSLTPSSLLRSFFSCLLGGLFLYSLKLLMKSAYEILSKCYS